MSLEIKYTNGLEFIPFEYADKDMILDLEIAMELTPMAYIQVNCYKCRKPIPAGIGPYCEIHQ